MTVLPSRHFNTVTFRQDGRVEKKGQSVKIAAEVDWYANWPTRLSRYVPTVHEYDKVEDRYVMDFVPMQSLAAYLVHGSERIEFWEEALREIFLMLDYFREKVPVNYWIEDPNLIRKSKERIKSLNGKDKEHAEELIAVVATLKTYPAYVHGDMCFSNILMNDQNTPMLVDPRGPNVIGSQAYDLAKMYHSTHGMYDFLVAGVEVSPEKEELCDWLGNEIDRYASITLGLSHKDLLAMTALLFYTMLPLHTDDFKKLARLLERAEQLYFEWKGFYG